VKATGLREGEKMERAREKWMNKEHTKHTKHESNDPNKPRSRLRFVHAFTLSPSLLALITTITATTTLNQSTNQSLASCSRI
jgi:hypothetical protein